MDRREFLIWTAGAVGLPLLGSRSNTIEFASGYGPWVDSAIDRVDPSLPSQIVFYNPSSRTMSYFPVPFRVHSVVQSQERKEQIILISKWGKQIASFNRRLGKVEKIAEAAPFRRFFGHAVWDQAEKGFWVSEQDDKSGQGKVVLRGEDLSIRREFDSQGIYPHDIQMPKPGILIVANNGDYYGLGQTPAELRPPMLLSNLTWVETKNGKTIRQVEFPDLLRRAGASHFHLIDGDKLIFVGCKTKSDEDTSVVIRIAQDEKPQVLQPRSGTESLFRGETISFAVYNGQVIWTHSKEKGVFAAKLNELSADLLLPQRCRGIAVARNSLIVSHAKKPILMEMDKSGRIRDIRAPNLNGHRWGSHLSRIDGYLT